MALRTDQLHEENSKLRQEIRKLQEALHTMKVEGTEAKSPVRSPRWRLDEEKREALASEIREKVERGIFDPPKTPRGRGREREGKRSRSTSRELTLRTLPRDSSSSELHHELSEEISGIEASLDTIQSAKPELGPSLRQELENLRKSVKRFASKSPKAGGKNERKSTEEGEEYEDREEKGTNKTLAQQIEALRVENERLRAKLVSQPAKSPRPKASSRSRSNSNTPSRSPRPKSPYSRSPSSRTPRSGTSPSARSSHSKSPLRYKHCKVCDYLLSKGFSTVYCSKHGSK